MVIAFTTIILIAGFSFIVYSSLSAINTFNEAVSTTTEESLQALDEKVESGSLKQTGASTYELNVTNTGDTKIPLSRFTLIDLFATLNDSGRITTIWLPWDQDAVSPTYWRVDGVYFNGVEGEITNPLSFTSGHGFWDPGEKLRVALRLNSSQLELEVVQFFTPNGVQTASSFSLDSTFGVATILDGDMRVDVFHGLAASPGNIQVTPVLNLGNNAFWVGNISDTSFSIYLRLAAGSDSSFYWLCSK